MTAISQDLADLRREYSNKPLRRTDLDSDPIVQFDRWFQDATRALALEPNAMNVASAASSSIPTSAAARRGKLTAIRR
jgi:pyridoxamine 5'-phosphate oxidase